MPITGNSSSDSLWRNISALKRSAKRQARSFLGVLFASVLFLGVAIDVPRQRAPRAQEHAKRGLHFAQTGDLAMAEAEFRRAVALSPNDPKYLAALGSILAMEQKLKEAKAYFEKALKLDPNDLEVRRDLAVNQWQLGDLHRAKANLEWILKRDPGDKKSILLLGMVAETLKNYATAAKLLQSVREEVEQRPESIAALVHSLYETGQRKKAQEILEGLLRDSANPKAVFLGAEVAAEANDYNVAEKLFTSIRSVYPDIALLGYKTAIVQYRERRFTESRKTLLDLISAGYESSDIYNLLGWSYESQNKLEEAVRAFNHAVDLEPSKESNYLDLARVLMEHQSLPSALEVAKKAVDLFPTSYEAYDLKGMIETRRSDFPGAVKSYARAAELNPKSPEANLVLAKAQSAAGLNEEAAATLERGMKRFHRDAKHYQEYALLLLKRGESGDTAARPQALTLLETAVGLDSSLPESHYQLGRLRMEEGQFTKALEQLETAAKLDPQSSKIHYALWHSYRQLGRTEEASVERALFEKSKAEEDKTPRGSAQDQMPPY